MSSLQSTDTLFLSGVLLRLSLDDQSRKY